MPRRRPQNPKPPRARPGQRLRPDRIDDGTRRAELAEAIAGLTAEGVLDHLPSEESMARTRQVLAEGWAVSREASLPNLEALQLLLAFLSWVGTLAAARHGAGTPPRLAIQLTVATAPAEAPAPPQDTPSPTASASVAVADALLEPHSPARPGEANALWELPC